jgi:hypothetical protein
LTPEVNAVKQKKLEYGNDGVGCLAGRIGVPACSLAAKKATCNIKPSPASLYRRGRLYAQDFVNPCKKVTSQCIPKNIGNNLTHV